MYDVTTWKTILIYLLPNISRSKGNQTMKFGLSIEYNMRNNFLGKWCTKCGGEIIPLYFLKKSKLIISLDHISKVLYLVCFYCQPSWGLSKYIENNILNLPPLKFLKNKKRDLELVPLLHFLYDF